MAVWSILTRFYPVISKLTSSDKIPLSKKFQRDKVSHWLAAMYAQRRDNFKEIMCTNLRSPLCLMIMKYNQIWQVYTVTEVSIGCYKEEKQYLVLNRTLLTTTESKPNIIFSIKNLIRDKSKSTERNCWKPVPEYRLDLLWELEIISRLLNAQNVPRHWTKLASINKKD